MSIVRWFVSPPDTAPSATVFLRLMAGSVFLWEGLMKLAFQNQGVGRFTKLGMPWPATTAHFVAGLEIAGGILITARASRAAERGYSLLVGALLRDLVYLLLLKLLQLARAVAHVVELAPGLAVISRRDLVSAGQRKLRRERNRCESHQQHDESSELHASESRK